MVVIAARLATGRINGLSSVGVVRVLEHALVDVASAIILHAPASAVAFRDARARVDG